MINPLFIYGSTFTNKGLFLICLLASCTPSVSWAQADRTMPSPPREQNNEESELAKLEIKKDAAIALLYANKFQEAKAQFASLKKLIMQDTFMKIDPITYEAVAKTVVTPYVENILDALEDLKESGVICPDWNNAKDFLLKQDDFQRLEKCPEYYVKRVKRDLDVLESGFKENNTSYEITPFLDRLTNVYLSEKTNLLHNDVWASAFRSLSKYYITVKNTKQAVDFAQKATALDKEENVLKNKKTLAIALLYDNDWNTAQPIMASLKNQIVTDTITVVDPVTYETKIKIVVRPIVKDILETLEILKTKEVVCPDWDKAKAFLLEK
jgi:tetratricopeptide (TPR) repeat protein